jgi:hypothetical protein
MERKVDSTGDRRPLPGVLRGERVGVEGEPMEEWEEEGAENLRGGAHGMEQTRVTEVDRSSREGSGRSPGVGAGCSR